MSGERECLAGDESGDPREELSRYGDPVDLPAGARLNVEASGRCRVVLALAKMSLPRDRRIWGHMLFVALFGSAVPFTLFAFGGQTVDSGVSGVLNSTTPLFALAYVFGPRHGYEVARWVRTTTDGELNVDDGALYTALHRLQKRGWLKASSGAPGRRGCWTSWSTTCATSRPTSITSWTMCRLAAARACSPALFIIVIFDLIIVL